jgi:hypothetical protein
MRRVIGLMLAAAVLAAGGCNEPQRADRGTDAYEYGRVYLLSGAGGMMGECDRIRDGLKQAGVRRAIETFHWSRGGVLTDQTGVEANRRKARDLSRRIEAFKRVSPGAPVHLIGVSAGTGLVVWALEDLEPGMDVTAAILISSSLDTRYDLTTALRNTRDGIYSFKSVADTVLSLGVTWAGTVDRNGGLAGGLVGFAPPGGASEETKRLYEEKLHEIGWWPGDTVLGHLGDHLGATSPGYVKAKVAPIVLGQEPPRPPEEPPTFEAVRRPKADADADAEKASETPDEAAPEPRKPTPVEEQAEKARRDLEEQSGSGGAKAPAAPSDPEDRARFHDWRVGTGGKGGAPVDEAAFFARPERLP